MANTEIFEIDNHDIELKNYQKINIPVALNDTVILKFGIFNNNAPVDITQFNVEFRAYLPKSSIPYSQVDNIVKSGNTLTITCDKELCQEIGQIQATLRIWNTQMLQKSNYLIVLKVMSTIPSDEVISSVATLSAVNSLDWSINRYVELRATLGDKIDEANLAITSISKSITNANNTISNINSTINNANTTKLVLDATISNANTAKTSLDNSITVANISKTNLQDKITEGKSLIPSLTLVNNTAQITKSELQGVVNTADEKLQEFKDFDTNQIIEKTNEMYNEMFAINELLTIEHNLEVNPLVQFIIINEGYGMGGFGQTSYGGVSECNLGTYKVQYLNKNKLSIIVSNNYYKKDPIITKINDYEYNVCFSNYAKTMLIKLLVIDNNSYLIDEDGNYIIDELQNYLMG